MADADLRATDSVGCRGAFPYTALDTSRNEIRLLYPTMKTACEVETVDSQLVVPDLHLEFELRTLSLDEQPGYTALSYVWGTKICDTPIKINDKSFTVTENLYRALQHLQYKDIAPAVWIDAICINQSDNEEKSHQVSLMRQMFSCASSVIIWLGPQAEHSDLIAAFLWEYPDRLRSHFNIAKADVDDLIDGISNFNSEDEFWGFFESVLTSVPNVGDWKGDEFLLESVDLICRLKWWPRAWVIQEFVLARECHFQIGTGKIIVDALALFFTSFIQHLVSPAVSQSLNQVRKVMTKKQKFPDYDWPMYLFVCRERGINQDFTLYDLLCQIYCRPSNVEQDHLIGATDRRDFIYGLYALVKDDFRKLGISIDYNKSWNEVFTDVAYRIIRAGYLDILALCQWTPSTRELARWTPTWHRRIVYSNAWIKIGQGKGR